MAQLLGQVAVGSIVKLNENGSPTNYIVVNQGIPGNSPLYDASCNGTWLLRQNTFSSSPFVDGSSGNNYSQSTLSEYLNEQLIPCFTTSIQNSIKTVKIPYCAGNNSSTVYSGSSGFQTKVFALSAYEEGCTTSINPPPPNDGVKLDYFQSGDGQSARNLRIAYRSSGAAVGYWTRSPLTNSFNNAWYIQESGTIGAYISGTYIDMRPALIFPQSMVVLDDGTLSAGLPAPTLTVPSQAMQGQSIPINWTASANADSYQLQRNTGSGWSTIYTGPNLSFEDTAGAWATVQYRVAAGLGGEYGDYATSAAIAVISASALVISGSDEDLGTITADIPYTVTSDTGNQITHTLTVNGVQFATATEASGVAHSIPVMELPTGTGTIVITASVQATSGPVTATRTWTYTKTAQTFPASAGVGSLAQNGASFLPQTLAECVRTNPFWGGSLSTALEMLTGVAQNGAQIEVGSYTGTGSYGLNSKNTYTFSRPPKFVIILGDDDYISNAIGFYVWGMKYMGGANGTDGGENYAYPEGNQLSWFSAANSASQLNQSGVKYYVVSFY